MLCGSRWLITVIEIIAAWSKVYLISFAPTRRTQHLVTHTYRAFLLSYTVHESDKSTITVKR